MFFFLAAPWARANPFPVVGSLAELEAFVDDTWTNHPMPKVSPPDTPTFLDLGPVVFSDSFPTAFLNSLVAVTNGAVVLRPIHITETNAAPRRRLYANASAVPVYTTTTFAAGYPLDWIVGAYGAPPGYLSGATLAAWYAERDPSRTELSLELLSTSAVPVYLQQMSNDVPTVEGTNLLAVYSNEIAFVSFRHSAGLRRLLLHAPPEVALLDLFRASALPPAGEWTHLAVLGHGSDPLPYLDGSGLSNAFYALANALHDGDGDGLASGRELFLYGTSATTNDTDGDGLLDGLELLVYGTDPNNTDSDGDGVSDGDEATAGLNPNARDTDLDWFSDGYEIAQGANPAVSNIAPAFDLFIGDGGPFLNNPSTTLGFTGMVADAVSIGLSLSPSQRTTNAFETVLPFSLPNEDGDYAVYCRLHRNNGAVSPAFGASVSLDRQPPQLSITNPAQDIVTNARWVDLLGTVTDAVSYARVQVNGEYAQIANEERFAHRGILLNPGTNLIVVVATDLAGNSVVVTQRVVQDAGGDEIAPVARLVLPFDQQVVGGQTQVFEQTTLGAGADFHFSGWVDDETARVEVQVSQEDGPVRATSPLVLGTNFFGRIPLEGGSNHVRVVATDAAGNRGEVQYTVIRDMGYTLEITNPAPFQVVGASQVVVRGRASLMFAGARIEVNGMGTHLESVGDWVHFSTTNPVPLATGLTQLSGFAELDGRRYSFDPSVADYELTRKEARVIERGTGGARVFGTETLQETLTATSRIWGAVDAGRQTDTFYSWTRNFVAGAWQAPVVSNRPPVVVAPSAVFSGPVRCGSDGALSSTEGTVVSWAQTRAAYRGRMRFVKHDPQGGRQLVLLKLLNLGDYPAHEVKLWGQPGFEYLGHAAFLVPIEIGREYEITPASFEVPTVRRKIGHYRVHAAQVHFTDVSNSAITVDLDLMWETGNKANQIFNPAKKDDPYPGHEGPEADDYIGVPRNNLYVVGDSTDEIGVSLALDIQPEYLRDKIVGSVMSSGGAMISGSHTAVPADSHTPVQVVFSAASEPHSFDLGLFAGFDANGNGELDLSESKPLEVYKDPGDASPQYARIQGSKDARHDSAMDEIDDIVDGDWTLPGWLTSLVLPHAKRLLQLFRDGSAAGLPVDKQPTGPNSPVTLDAFGGYFSEWLTHNSGAGFSDSGVATITQYTWQHPSSTEDLIGSAGQFKEALRAFYFDTIFTEVQTHFASLPPGSVAEFPVDGSWPSIPLVHESQVSGIPQYTVELDDGNPLTPPKGDDVNGTVGRGRVLSHIARFTVLKTLVGTTEAFVVTQVRSVGTIIDLYDFHYEVGGAAQNAAILQIGHGKGSYGASRDYGKIYRNRIEFDVTYTELP